MSQNTIPANSDKPCACCGRIHRKLYLIDGYWMGKTCAEQYKLYRNGWRNITDIVWKGYEKQYLKVLSMVKAS